MAEHHENVFLLKDQLKEAFQSWIGGSSKMLLAFASPSYNKQLLLGQSSIFHSTWASALRPEAWQYHSNFVCFNTATTLTNFNTINYSVAFSQFGKVLVAATDNGICHLAFGEQTNKLVADLRTTFPNSSIEAKKSAFHDHFLEALANPQTALHRPLALDLQGTAFQKKVWKTLLSIPFGQLQTYSQVAKIIEVPAAVRAVASAIGNNPVAWLIPCHRVVRNDGAYGGFKWGLHRKAMMIGWEAWQINKVLNKTIPN